MKINEIRDLSAEEINVRLADLEKESFNLRFQLAMGDIENPMRIREVRKTIAKMHTILREKQLGN
ncbi:MAG: 50S ribosomal protein L29 [Nitrospirae bacterium]|nr:50S ribosomal protein L29 [Nitrospirota bacterium]MBI5694914.1 50S ribosomal protein L29 [Nitrospirota bacterium]